MSSVQPAEPAETSANRRTERAARWQRALAGTSYVALSHEQVRQRLVPIVEQAEAILLPGSPPEAGRTLGAALVQLGYNSAEALAASVNFLVVELSTVASGDQANVRQRFLGEFAAGFMHGAQQVALTEQEAIRSALLAQRAQAEAALRDSEARFRAIFEGAAIAVAVGDHQGRLVATNPALQAMLGYTAQEMLGQPFTAFAHPDDARAHWHFFEELARGQRDSYQTEERYLRRDGGIVWARMTVSLVRDGDGRPRFAIGMGEDITERMQAAEAFAQQYMATETARSETRAILDATVEAVLLVSPDGVVRTVNRRCEQILGLTQENLANRTFHELQPELEQRFIDPAAVALLTATITDTEERFTRDLYQRWPVARTLELFSTPVRSVDSLLLGRLYAFRDVTREREVDRMKSEFVSLVSHEMRTPLTSIKGYAYLLLSGDTGELASEQRTFAQVIIDNADRLSAMIDAFLDLSRIESGRMELVRAPVDLAALIASVITSIRPQVEAKRQRLVTEIAGDLPPLSGDAGRLAQIMTNLVSNAQKYTPPGGTITVAARQEGESLHLSVADTGIGISPEERAQLFTRFYRASNRETQAVGGTGLGLAITKSLVELHGGSISVRSEPGAGATFTVVLPAVSDTVERLPTR
ncbi:MAG TPA: PAS domain S-box protein [Chloroflexota bacterium]|nr:PAS domain S-box protein [Chloroflexota bacterium]